MSIIACGINHKTASVALREKVFFAPEKYPLYLQDLLSSGLIKEAVLLSTCNRSELYCESEDPQGIQDWFCREGSPELRDALYLYQDQAAVEHLMKVACGLDSMVLGEPEILGQVKAAFSESCTAGAVGHSFYPLFQKVFAIAKEIRSTTAIGACPMSIASTTMALAKQLLESHSKKPLSEVRLLLLGAGDTIQLILRYLQATPVQKIWIANRSLEKAEQLASTYDGEALALHQLGSILPQADLLVTATGSLEPLLTQVMLAKHLSKRKTPLMIFDLAVPRDVEPEVATLPGVQLYCIDDLKVIIQKNYSNRQHAAEKALEVIRERSREWLLEQHSKDQVSDAISAYRGQIEAICEVELTKALRLLAKRQDAEMVLRQFAYGVTNKLLHAPSVQLRKAGSEGRLDLLRLAKQLLAIPEFEQKLI